jgi:ABC-2 type transport system ATP-binding protein
LANAEISVNNLTVKIKGELILDSVSFAAAGEVIGIAGPNGSGKSTLLRAIDSASRSSSTSITLRQAGGGKPNVGYLPQTFDLPSELTVREFVEYAAWLKKAPADNADIDRSIASVRLEEFSAHKLRTVSGGVAQRAGFASVLVEQPDILLLDEPTTGVDLQQREVMRGIIAAQGPGRLTILTSHIVEDLEQLCDRILVLVNGRMVFLGTAQEACAAAESPLFADALLALTGAQR